MSGRRILVVAYTFPPMPTIGANRWDAMARHLRRRGHQVHVVSTAAFGGRRDQDEERHVSRATDLTAAPWVRRAFRRGPMPPPSDAPTGERSDGPPETPLPAWLRRIIVPDLYAATWVPAALPLARRLVTEHRIECVITTSPYESTHLIGLALRRRPNVAWVADFRDGWSYEPHRPPLPLAAQRWLDSRLERAVITHANRVVAATRPIAEDFRRRLGVEAAHIPNGFDPVRYGSLPQVEIPKGSSDALNLVHTGTLAGVSNRDPRGLFAAMRQLRETEPAVGDRLRLVLAGRLDTEEVRLVSESRLEGQVVRMGELSHAEALALQRRADALVLVTSGGSEVTGKLFEYLAAGRPILALAGPSVAEIIASTRTGVTVAPDDPPAIVHQLRRLVEGQLAATFEPTGLEPYVYPGPAESMAELIEEAINDL